MADGGVLILLTTIAKKWLLAAGILFFTCISSVQAMEIEDLIRHMDKLWRGETSHALMSMQVTTKNYQRTMVMETWSRGMDHSLVVIKDPIKDRGVATLKVKENIWNYLPKIDRVAKVPSSMMSGSWMGSHFTNDDLVRESTFETDYDSTISYAGMRDGRLVYEIMSIPKENSAVVWGKIVMIMDQKTLAPLTSEYYDEEGELMRKMLFDKTRKINGFDVPMRMTLLPNDKPDESTIVEYQSIEFAVPLQENFFSLQNLKKGL
ncbi:MAG: outer membrane lipoprotein-sorting protein [Gammaproteobacteria bacterium]|nr:outer membrane lipoprotein-sorting protein [Gammaproteobacteria bacterium]